jgi:hypothetical protein
MTAFITASVPTSTVINVAPQQFTPQKDSISESGNNRVIGVMERDEITE